MLQTRLQDIFLSFRKTVRQYKERFGWWPDGKNQAGILDWIRDEQICDNDILEVPFKVCFKLGKLTEEPSEELI